MRYNGLNFRPPEPYIKGNWNICKICGRRDLQIDSGSLSNEEPIIYYRVRWKGKTHEDDSWHSEEEIRKHGYEFAVKTFNLIFPFMRYPYCFYIKDFIITTELLEELIVIPDAKEIEELRH
jgi:hypothetical protein